MGAATALTSCSAFLAGEVAGRMGVTRPIHVVPNGIDLPWFDSLGESGDVYAAHGLPRRRLMIVFTGRLERRKGIHLCPEIAGTILERHDVTFVLAGADLFDYATTTLLPEVSRRRLKGSIHWLGALTLPQVRQLVSAAGIFLLPSVWENCPYSVLEAMAAGKAVVAADQGGVPEMITSGTQGLLARAGDPTAFVAALERLIADEPLRHRLGAAARARVEQEFAHTTIAARSVELYRQVMARKAAS
jgi:starch synthase